VLIVCLMFGWKMDSLDDDGYCYPLSKGKETGTQEDESRSPYGHLVCPSGGWWSAFR